MKLTYAVCLLTIHCAGTCAITGEYPKEVHLIVKRYDIDALPTDKKEFELVRIDDVTAAAVVVVVVIDDDDVAIVVIALFSGFAKYLPTRKFCCVTGTVCHTMRLPPRSPLIPGLL